MNSFRENSCSSLSTLQAGYVIISLNLIFILQFITIHVIQLLHIGYGDYNTNPHKTEDYIFLYLYLGTHSINSILTATLYLGLRNKSLKSCQIYMFGSVLMLLCELITVITAYVYLHGKTAYKFHFYAMTAYPIYFLYTAGSLWVVRWFIVQLIRNSQAVGQSNGHNPPYNGHGVAWTKDCGEKGGSSRNSTEYYEKPGRYQIAGDISTSTTPSNDTKQHQIQHFSGTGVGRSQRTEIDDILHKFEFPKNEQIPSDMFRVEAEVLKIEDDYYVKKGLLEISLGNFKPVSVKIFKPKMELDDIQGMVLEAKILSKFRNHPNIIQLLGCCTENIHKGKMILLLEYCQGGNVEDFLRQNYEQFVDSIYDDKFNGRSSSLSENDESLYQNITLPSTSTIAKQPIEFNSRTLVSWSFQMTSGMEFISEKQIIHGNLSTKNLILDKGRIKISNFTFSTQLDRFRNTNSPIKFCEDQLPWRWMALECLKLLKESNFSEKSDVWSCGVTLWEIFTLGCVPYDGLSTSEFFPKLLTGERLEKPGFATTQMYQIMKGCWHEDPTVRHGFTELNSQVLQLLQSI